MFDIGFSELVLIAVVALVAIGPKDLPVLLFRFGRFVRRINIFVNNMRNEYGAIMHDAELTHYRQEFEKNILLPADKDHGTPHDTKL